MGGGTIRAGNDTTAWDRLYWGRPTRRTLGRQYGRETDNTGREQTIRAAWGLTIRTRDRQYRRHDFKSGGPLHAIGWRYGVGWGVGGWGVNKVLSVARKNMSAIRQGSLGISHAVGCVCLIRPGTCMPHLPWGVHASHTMGCACLTHHGVCMPHTPWGVHASHTMGCACLTRPRGFIAISGTPYARCR